MTAQPQVAKRSLRSTLLLTLAPGLFLLGAAEVWQAWRTAEDAANAAYDRSLYGAIKAMDANISTASGGLGVELPYRLLEFFELTANGRVYYRVATEGGLVEIGNADLPLPTETLLTKIPHFQDAIYFEEPVRVASYARVLAPPLAGQPVGQRVVIQIAETLESRQAFIRQLVWESVTRDVLLLGSAMALMVLAVAWALEPIARLLKEVQGRSAYDLTPISSNDIPADLKPLVEAVNHHIERNRQHTEARQRFIDDASHQLRTPLATLMTQVSFALREVDPKLQREALVAMKLQLEETVRQTNQMLALARVDSAGIHSESTNIAPIVEQLTRAWWQSAREKGIDLGYESEISNLIVDVQPGMLKEAITNLLHNAISYTPLGGHITVRLSRNATQARISVIDDGPGISEQDLAHVGERFFKTTLSTQTSTGLGLAITRSIAERHGGMLELGVGDRWQGLSASIVLPLT